MKKSRFTESQIVSVLKEADAGMKVSEVKRLRELEKENTELKRMVADQALDIRMLRDVNSKKW